MGEFEKVKKTFDGMVQMLKYTSEETPKILEKNTVRPLERHLKAIESQTDEIHAMKLEIQKQMIQKGDIVKDVQKWKQDKNDHLAVYEESVEEIEHKIKTLKEHYRVQERRKEEDKEELRRQRQYEQELKLEEAKQKMKQEIEKKMERAQEKPLTQDRTLHAKLPKLVITKF